MIGCGGNDDFYVQVGGTAVEESSVDVINCGDGTDTVHLWNDEKDPRDKFPGCESYVVWE